MNSILFLFYSKIVWGCFYVGMCVCGCNGAGFVFVLSVYCDGIVFSFFLCSVTSIRVCSLLLFSAYVVKCVVFLSSMRKKSYLYLVFF